VAQGTEATRRRSATTAQATVLRLLEADPDLGRGLSPEHLAIARRELIVKAIVLPRPGTDIERLSRALKPQLGLLILDGVLLRDVEATGKLTSELLGPGDIVFPWPEARALSAIEATSRITSLTESRIALLDARFVAMAARWPTILGEIAGGSAARTRETALRLLVAQLVRIEDRVLLALWALAERFGRVTSDGVLLPLPLTHRLIGQLVGGTRPTVTTALGRLARAGTVVRTEHGWLLAGEPPSAIAREGSDGDGPPD
jgi:CRP/FNR family transcriptional regulator, cyclic AMP receptor protein